MDLSNLMQIANQLREQMSKSQAEAANLRISGEAGGGMVRLVLNFVTNNCLKLTPDQFARYPFRIP